MAFRLHSFFLLPASARSNPSPALVSPALSSVGAHRSIASQASAKSDAGASVSAAVSIVSRAPQSPVFLPHLGLVADAGEGGGVAGEVEVEGGDVEEEGRRMISSEEGETGWELEEEFYGEEEEDAEEHGEDSDPIRSFFESKAPTRDPEQEGRTSLQKNRRTSWRIADAVDVNSEEDGLEEITLGLELDSEIPISPSEDEGVVDKILKIARNIAENSTLGELLGSFEGKVDEGDCIHLLARMGKEGLISECLYFFEWMGLQRASLVTPRSCSVLFPVLGRAGKGRELMTLFKNLPRSKRFRDVHVYNATISGLACSGR